MTETVQQFAMLQTQGVHDQLWTRLPTRNTTLLALLVYVEVIDMLYKHAKWRLLC